MNYEMEIAALLEADATLMSILTGGVYADSELGVEGLVRGVEESPSAAAFNDDGVLLPCAVVHQRAAIPTEDIYDMEGRHISVRQMLEIYYHEFRGHTNIDLAKARVRTLLFNVRLTNTFPLVCEGESAYFYDVGPVSNSTVLRQDWLATYSWKP